MEIFADEMTNQMRSMIRNAANDEERNAIEDSAFETWICEKYGHGVLAYAFLKYPNANLDKFLADWQRLADNYQRQRSASVRPADCAVSNQQRIVC